MTARRSRAGFTLLEMVMAATLGGLVVAGSAAVLGMLTRVEETMTRRHIHVSQMGTLHNLLQDVFGTVIVSNTPRPDESPETEEGGETEDEEEDGETPEEPDAATLNAQVERARMILGIDENLGGFLATFDSSRGLPDTTGGVQSFEMVTGRQPGGYDLPARLTSQERAVVRATRLATRGVLELRPDPTDPRAWALWWRPVDPDGESFYSAFEFDRDQQAILLMQGIERMRWQVYDDEQRKADFRATWQGDLPAYVEVEVAMTSGLYANWMFEIGWSVAAEQVVSGVVENDGQGSAETDGGGADGGAGGGDGGGFVPGGRDGARRGSPAVGPGSGARPGAPATRPSDAPRRGGAGGGGGGR